MGKEDNFDKGLDQKVDHFGISVDEVVMLAYAMEYGCNDGINGLVGAILEKIEHGLSVDTYIGNRLAEYGRIMGWSKEQR